MYETFTDRARKVMQLANEEAKRLRHEYIGTEHVLLGLVKEGSGVAANVLKNLDIDLRKIRSEIEKIVQSGPEMVSVGKLPQTPRAKKVIEYAIEEARKLDHNYVGTEHLLLALLREEEGVASQVLMSLGLHLEELRREVLSILGQAPQRRQTLETKGTPSLDRFGLDLTAEARAGKLRAIVGRHQEVERLRSVLGCKTQNSPVLVGHPGIGRSTLVKGLARELAQGRGPETRLVAVSIDRMLAQADDPAGLVTSFSELLAEAAQAKNIVIYFDDAWSLLVRGAGWTGARATATFRAALSEGNLRCIATATPQVYQSAIAPDNILARHMRPLFLQPLSAEETLDILRGLRPLYESHHRLRITNDALGAVISLSERHFPEAPLPGKAVQLLDEAAARISVRHFSPPLQELLELERQIQELNRAKEEAVREQDFQKATELRDQADRLKKRHEGLTEQRRLEEESVPVDSQAIAEAVRLVLGREPEQEKD
jgi:ATP-dependent Clp protease ATP-binding subunit ClpC